MKKLCLILAGLIVLLSGCVKDWLDLEPKSEVSADVLFETPEGFSIALNGIYTSLSSTTLYGAELTHGFVDVLGRCYDLKNTQYDPLKNYDYVSNGMEQRINSIWALAYSTIANCNGLLEEMNKKDATFFKPHERARLEGEVLSLRAMLYFDLLRLYAPAPAVQDAAAIPYYTELTHVPRPEKRTSEILQLLIADLTRSKALQKEFDTRPTARRDFHEFRFRFNDDETFFGYGKRGFRMGYFATTALLSRVALYAGDDRLAYDNAMEVINDKTADNEATISFTPATVIDVNVYDRLLSDDLIFALYRIKFEEEFNKVIFLLPNTSPIFGSDLNSDYRKKCYLTADGRQLMKFDMEQEREGFITSAIPLFRLSELYHIAAEALYDTDPEGALALLNTLRAKRGCTVPLSSIASKSAFEDAIINDARREFVGEGKLFFLYKRLNKTILDEYGGNQALTDKFVLPVTER
ncbi:RagB/SusD family nutrient uptake outer membrane protein [Chitinophaga sp. GCM10012297]|uniref:RagB/SusD family nutrient uptake outer membrane protein n=1 Tax=Chitinophaga chungangae TaxID=2821488 RepID=A0ABS3YGC6_9BACT|nr:RagB/SusD family nutrient uptake outer membrane protein [Chitinophaga chungangae]MBO9153505.1 RagB/SusD family nutrient uptake outer membrane protein [Chitinophaga chungangae]